MAARRNPLAAPTITDPAPGNPLSAPMTAADVWDYNAPVLADAYRTAQTPEFWVDAARQYAQAMLAGSVAPGRGIRAFHGSPYDFDRFDLSKIGTGEGAQAYGHGLYFAGNEGVAELYRRVVGGGGNGWSVTKPPAIAQLSQSELTKLPDDILGRLTASWQNNGPDVAQNLARKYFDQSRGTEYSDILHKLAYKSDWSSPGHMYEVEIAATPDQLLDWDKPLSQQPQGVREAVASAAQRGVDAGALYGLPPAERTGAEIYNVMRAMDPRLQTYEGFYNAPKSAGQSAAAEALRTAGIPGIQYLDAGSRSAGEGSRNYVVFDDALINILRKYGLAGLITAGAAANPLMARDDQ